MDYNEIVISKDDDAPPEFLDALRNIVTPAYADAIRYGIPWMPNFSVLLDDETMEWYAKFQRDGEEVIAPLCGTTFPATPEEFIVAIESYLEGLRRPI